MLFPCLFYHLLYLSLNSKSNGIFEQFSSQRRPCFNLTCCFMLIFTLIASISWDRSMLSTLKIFVWYYWFEILIIWDLRPSLVGAKVWGQRRWACFTDFWHWRPAGASIAASQPTLLRRSIWCSEIHLRWRELLGLLFLHFQLLLLNLV